jgi:hypothetical protein
MNAAFIALTFILLIVIIFLARDMTEAVLIISVLANLLVISSHFGVLSRGLIDITTRDGEAPDNNTNNNTDSNTDDTHTDTSVNSDVVAAHPDGDMYGPFYDQWAAYKGSYTTAYDAPRMAVGTGAEQAYTVDERNALLAQQRARDRKCSDGWLTKDKYYYEYHYGSELADEEAKAWWGRHEY